MMDTVVAGDVRVTGWLSSPPFTAPARSVFTYLFVLLLLFPPDRLRALAVVEAFCPVIIDLRGSATHPTWRTRSIGAAPSEGGSRWKDGPPSEWRPCTVR